MPLVRDLDTTGLGGVEAALAVITGLPWPLILSMTLSFALRTPGLLLPGVACVLM